MFKRGWKWLGLLLVFICISLLFFKTRWETWCSRWWWGCSRWSHLHCDLSFIFLGWEIVIIFITWYFPLLYKLFASHFALDVILLVTVFLFSKRLDLDDLFIIGDIGRWCGRYRIFFLLSSRISSDFSPGGGFSFRYCYLNSLLCLWSFCLEFRDDIGESTNVSMKSPNITISNPSFLTILKWI